jgi:hypothetical protein
LGATLIEKDVESINRTYCELFFNRAYKEILASHFWNFATKRAYAVETTGPLYGYDNAFTVPSDSIRVWAIDDNRESEWKKVGTAIHTNLGDTADSWATATSYIAGQYVTNNSVTYICILAHTAGDADDEPGVGAATATYWTSQSGDYQVLPVEYVYDVSDLSTWPDYAIQPVVYNLAIKLCPPIKQDEDSAIALQKMLLDPRIGHLTLAKSSDAQEGGGLIFMSNHFIDARTRGLPWRGR